MTQTPDHFNQLLSTAFEHLEQAEAELMHIHTKIRDVQTLVTVTLREVQSLMVQSDNRNFWTRIEESVESECVDPAPAHGISKDPIVAGIVSKLYGEER